MISVTACRYLASFASLQSLPTTGFPEIAFAGRSNVGKSSLINSLLGRRRLAKISSTPGKTRTLNYYLVNRGFYFVDLPGYGYARVSKGERLRWQQLVEPYLRDRLSLCGVIQLIDLRHQPMDSDRQLWEWLGFHDRPTLIVLTKADKLSRGKARASFTRAGQLLETDERRMVSFSARTHQGRDRVWRWIEKQISI
jgi:GTP-binding protein